MEWVSEWLENNDYRKKWIPRLYFLAGISVVLLVALRIYKMAVPSIIKVLVLVLIARIINLTTKPLRRSRKQMKERNDKMR